MIAKMMARQGVTTAIGGNCGVMNQPVREFKAMMERLGGCPVNYAIMTGYNYYRNTVLGFEHYEKLTRLCGTRSGNICERTLKKEPAGFLSA